MEFLLSDDPSPEVTYIHPFHGGGETEISVFLHSSVPVSYASLTLPLLAAAAGCSCDVTLEHTNDKH